MKSIPDKKMTTSKIILWATYILFASQILLAMWFSYKEIGTDIFIYSVPSSAGLAGATTVFYMNKSKMENLFRYKIAFLEYKIDLINKHPESAELIDKEISSIEDTLDSEVDSTMQEYVDENVEIPSLS